MIIIYFHSNNETSVRKVIIRLKLRALKERDSGVGQEAALRDPSAAVLSKDVSLIFPFFQFFYSP